MATNDEVDPFAIPRQFGLRTLLIGVTLAALITPLVLRVLFKEPPPQQKRPGEIRIIKWATKQGKPAHIDFNVRFPDGTYEFYRQSFLDDRNGQLIAVYITRADRSDFYAQRAQPDWEPPQSKTMGSITPAMDAKFERLKEVVAAQIDVESISWRRILDESTKHDPPVTIPLPDDFSSGLEEPESVNGPAATHYQRRVALAFA